MTINKCVFLIVAIILGLTSHSFAEGCRIIVKDLRNNPVQFILMSQEKVTEKEKRLESDKNGVLKISDEEFEAYKEKSFRLEFVDKLADLLYDKVLQNESGEKPLAQDGYYKLSDLCNNRENYFIVPDLKRGLKPKR